MNISFFFIDKRDERVHSWKMISDVNKKDE